MTAPTPPLPLGRKLLSAALAALAVAILLLALTEAALRLVGYGHSPHFARRERQPNGEVVWRENRWCTAPYFPPTLVRRPVPFRLELRKPPGTFRIFVLGSSAAMGDPAPSFSLARMLGAMLRNAYPTIHFEVVNAGIPAVNSQVLRGLAEDCAALEPDLYIVYAGNNEVIGPFGPAGGFGPFFRDETAVRLAAWAEVTRTGQALNALVRAVTARQTGRLEWGARPIAATDPRLVAVQEHFRANLLAIAASARRAGASTLFCTDVVNQRDCAPFLSRHRDDLSAPERTRWDAESAAGLAAGRVRDQAVAEEHLRSALAIDDAYAEIPYRLGRLALANGREAEGRALLRRALELDTLRIRTDFRLNQVIREVAAAAPGASLVDLANELAAVSAQGCPGDDLLYEHVQLNFRGTYDATARLFPRVVAELEQRGLPRGAPPAPLSMDAARQRLAFTTYEEAMIGIELLQRFRAPPFTSQIDDGLRIAACQRRVDAANALLAEPGATNALAAIYADALNRNPSDWVLARNAGAMLAARGRPRDAIPLLQLATSIIPDDADTLVTLGLALRDAGLAPESAIVFARVRAIDPRHPRLPR